MSHTTSLEFDEWMLTHSHKTLNQMAHKYMEENELLSPENLKSFTMDFSSGGFNQWAQEMFEKALKGKPDDN